MVMPTDNKGGYNQHKVNYIIFNLILLKNYIQKIFYNYY